jgi:hypothetical protein
MKVEIRLTGSLHREILQDLARPHAFAAERVGFVFGRGGSLVEGGKLALLNRYHAIPDDQYVEDETVGARIGPDAITWAMQAVYHGRSAREGLFHIHVHAHKGEPRMSRVDSREIPKLMPGFQSVGREAVHGVIILSLDHGAGWVWLPRRKESVAADMISVSGKPLAVFEKGIDR